MDKLRENFIPALLIMAAIGSVVHHFLPSTVAKRAAEHQASVERSVQAKKDYIVWQLAEIAYCISPNGDWVRNEPRCLKNEE